MREAVLTIDDSPSPITEKILEFLRLRNIECIFFCIGTKLVKYPAVADLIVNSGFTLGNHSFSHSPFSKLTLSECEQEIFKTEELIDAVYDRNYKKRKAKHFRFPYGDKGGENRKSVQEILKKINFRGIERLKIKYDWYYQNSLDSDRDVFWTFDTLDYQLSDGVSEFTMEDLVSHLEGTSPDFGGVLRKGTSDEIVLLHDHENTEAIFPRYYEEIIKRIEEFRIKFRKRAF